MITLNTERGFVEVESWDDVLSLPGFTSDLDPKEHELKDIIGRYIFKETRACGLSSCHSPHMIGYVVSTKSGPVTNIGNVCGKNHFGVDFQQLSRRFEEDRNQQLNREIISSFLMQSDHVSEVLEGLLKSGGHQVRRNIRQLITPSKGCPTVVYRMLTSMARDQNPTLTKSRLLTKEERETLEVATGRPVSKEEVTEEEVGKLAGLEALFAENDLRDLLIVDLQSKLAELTELDIDSLDSRSLKSWAEWCQGVERKLENAADIVDKGKQFLDDDNLAKIALALEEEDRGDFELHLKHYQKSAIPLN